MWETILDTLFISSETVIRSVFALFLALLMGMVVSQIYKFTHTGIHYEPSLLSTLVLLAPVVTTVMLFIQGDLALTLGLVGALAIIRFRTPIKGTRDMVYLFWTIAVGIGMGTFNWMLALIATAIIGFIMVLFHFIKYENMPKNEFILVVSGNETKAVEQVREYVRQFDSNARMRSSKLIGDTWEIIFEMQISKIGKEKSDILLTELHKTKGVEKVSLLAPQISLPA